jgi:predicted SprT family Zn-dependent metalloprotease/ribosomal protein S27E
MARKTKTKTKLTTTTKKTKLPAKTPPITPLEYGGLQQAYDHFNKDLFVDAVLPNVLITYQRRAHSSGYFAADRFADRSGKTAEHELALNPDGFINKTDEQICQTLVHEMVHVWQHVHGTASKGGYHNKEWAAKMKALGLQPSSTGMVGGNKTGQRMSDYVIRGGPFTQAYAKLAKSGWRLNLESAHRAGKVKGPKSKEKFTCSKCGANVWGKPDSDVQCGPCTRELLRCAGVPARTMRSLDSVRMRCEAPASELAEAA